jgi:hypothetical protein
MSIDTEIIDGIAYCVTGFSIVGEYWVQKRWLAYETRKYHMMKGPVDTGESFSSLNKAELRAFMLAAAEGNETAIKWLDERRID